MKKWHAIMILALAQFVMVLDSTVMNVSISEVVADLNTSVSNLQMAITFYTLTMAALMLLGGKLGNILGKKKALAIGVMIYGLGSLITGLSQNITQLIIGWSFIEGLGAVLVIPAVASLVASNYKGRDRVTGYAILGGVAGAAAAAGPLIGGFVTTYFSWRYVFLSEVFIMAIVMLFSYKIADDSKPEKERINIPSVVLSVSGMVLLVYGMLQSKVWGFVTPRSIPEIAGHQIAPLGISLVAYFIIFGIVLLFLFGRLQTRLVEQGKKPLLEPALLHIRQLRSGLSVLTAQYVMIASLFFILPVYLQMTLEYNALETGIRIVPLSFAIIIFSILGSRLVTKLSPKQIVRRGQYCLIIGSVFLIGSVSLDLKSIQFGIGMAIIGAGLGLLASQLGNVNMSAVNSKQTNEVGGLQGVAQNLGSSLGTALIGSVMIASLSTNFAAQVSQAPDLPTEVKTYVQQNSQVGLPVVSAPQVEAYSTKKGLTESQAQEVSSIYSDSQVRALKEALFVTAILGLISMVFLRGLPDKVMKN